MKLAQLMLAIGLLLIVSLSHAVQDVELINVEDEPRFKTLANDLRCMVCQNQSIADSNADLARDFRNQVKEKINAGQTNEEIVEFMVARYGDYVLYRPPFNWATALLWTGPFLLVFVGVIVVFRMSRKKVGSNDAEDEALREKHEKLGQLLSQDQESGK